ncbi:MAG: TIGR04086 family membrane protein [Ruminococcaceae bacterium]|nr:TIGR04086 family membrane protein [Oscillospiraceae bacterium]
MGIIDLKRAVISSGVALILTFILFILCSLLTALSIIGDGAIRTVVIIITCISAFIGGYLTARNVYEYGLFNGLATGLIYFLMLYVLSVIMTFTFAANGELFKGLLFILIASGIGGVAGINSKAQRRRRKKASYPRYR